MQNKVLNELVYEICEIYIEICEIYRELCSVPALPTSYLELSGTLLPRGHCHAYPILQTDASDYGIGDYLYMVTNGKVRVIRFFNKALNGAQLNCFTRDLLLLLDFRGLTRQSSLHPAYWQYVPVPCSWKGRS